MIIENCRFGQFIIDHSEYDCDIKIIADKVKMWNFTEHHKVTVEDIDDILASKPEALIIGIGVNSLVKVNENVKDLLQQSGIKVLIKPTPQACSEFNRLEREGRKPAALLHATC